MKEFEEFEGIFAGLEFTFSRWCISGLVSDCKCHRCLKKAGIAFTEESEQLAEVRSKLETEEFRKRHKYG